MIQIIPTKQKIYYPTMTLRYDSVSLRTDSDLSAIRSGSDKTVFPVVSNERSIKQSRRYQSKTSAKNDCTIFAFEKCKTASHGGRRRRKNDAKRIIYSN